MSKNERNLLAAVISGIAVASICGSLLLGTPSRTHTQELEEKKPLDYRIEQQDVKLGPRDKQEIKCLREALWHEARGEGEEGLKAVLTVIINRKNHPDYPATFCRVIRQPRQFSYLDEVQRLEPKPKSQQEKHLLDKIEELAHDAVTARFNRTLPAATLWYHSSKVKPGWARAKIKVKVVGRHLFYRKKEQNEQKEQKV